MDLAAASELVRRWKQSLGGAAPDQNAFRAAVAADPRLAEAIRVVKNAKVAPGGSAPSHVGSVVSSSMTADESAAPQQKHLQLPNCAAPTPRTIAIAEPPTQPPVAPARAPVVLSIAKPAPLPASSSEGLAGKAGSANLALAAAAAAAKKKHKASSLGMGLSFSLKPSSSSAPASSSSSAGAPPGAIADTVVKPAASRDNNASAPREPPQAAERRGTLEPASSLPAGISSPLSSNQEHEAAYLDREDDDFPRPKPAAPSSSSAPSAAAPAYLSGDNFVVADYRGKRNAGVAARKRRTALLKAALSKKQKGLFQAGDADDVAEQQAKEEDFWEGEEEDEDGQDDGGADGDDNDDDGAQEGDAGATRKPRDANEPLFPPLPPSTSATSYPRYSGGGRGGGGHSRFGGGGGGGFSNNRFGGGGQSSFNRRGSSFVTGASLLASTAHLASNSVATAAATAPDVLDLCLDAVESLAFAAAATATATATESTASESAAAEEDAADAGTTEVESSDPVQQVESTEHDDSSAAPTRPSAPSAAPPAPAPAPQVRKPASSSAASKPLQANSTSQRPRVFKSAAALKEASEQKAAEEALIRGGVMTGGLSERGRPLCPGHRMEAALRKVKKDGPNKGRYFYCCPCSSKELSCGFFMWKDADVREAVASFLKQASATITATSASSSSATASANEASLGPKLSTGIAHSLRLGNRVLATGSGVTPAGEERVRTVSVRRWMSTSSYSVADLKEEIKRRALVPYWPHSETFPLATVLELAQHLDTSKNKGKKSKVATTTAKPTKPAATTKATAEPAEAEAAVAPAPPKFTAEASKVGVKRKQPVPASIGGAGAAGQSSSKRPRKGSTATAKANSDDEDESEGDAVDLGSDDDGPSADDEDGSSSLASSSSSSSSDDDESSDGNDEEDVVVVSNTRPTRATTGTAAKRKVSYRESDSDSSSSDDEEEEEEEDVSDKNSSEQGSESSNSDDSNDSEDEDEGFRRRRAGARKGQAKKKQSAVAKGASKKTKAPAKRAPRQRKAKAPKDSDGDNDGSDDKEAGAGAAGERVPMSRLRRYELVSLLVHDDVAAYRTGGAQNAGHARNMQFMAMANAGPAGSSSSAVATATSSGEAAVFGGDHDNEGGRHKPLMFRDPFISSGSEGDEKEEEEEWELDGSKKEPQATRKSKKADRGSSSSKKGKDRLGRLLLRTLRLVFGHHSFRGERKEVAVPALPGSSSAANAPDGTASAAIVPAMFQGGEQTPASLPSSSASAQPADESRASLTVQEWAIRRSLAGLDTLLVASTGTGKSLTYQLPAYLLSRGLNTSRYGGDGAADASGGSHVKGITVVVSPLLALIRDQMRGLPRGIHAVSLAAAHTNNGGPGGGGAGDDAAEALSDLQSGRAQILFISPERLLSPSFIRLCKQSLSYYNAQRNRQSNGSGAIDPRGPGMTAALLPPVALVAIDEAHVLCEWSHNFRPSYLRLLPAIRQFLQPRAVLALTATAAPHVVTSVAALMGLKPPTLPRPPTTTTSPITSSSSSSVVGGDVNVGDGLANGVWVSSWQRSNLTFTVSMVGANSSNHHDNAGGAGASGVVLKPSAAAGTASSFAVRCEYSDREAALLDFLRHLAAHWTRIEGELRRVQQNASTAAATSATTSSDAELAGDNDFPSTLIYVSTQAEAQTLANAINAAGIAFRKATGKAANSKKKPAGPKPKRARGGKGSRMAVDASSDSDDDDSDEQPDEDDGEIAADGTREAFVDVSVTASPFHAGMPMREREKVHARFLSGKARIVVATIAFGLGVDKRDLRVVVHHSPPRSLEEYLQQCGRAGRDGRPALCHCLLDSSSGDFRRSLGMQSTDGLVEASAMRDLVAAIGSEVVQSYCVAPRLVMGGRLDTADGDSLPWAVPSHKGTSVTRTSPPLAVSARYLPSPPRVVLPLDSLCQQLNLKPETVETLLCYFSGFDAAGPIATGTAAADEATSASTTPLLSVIAHRAAVVEVTLLGETRSSASSSSSGSSPPANTFTLHGPNGGRWKSDSASVLACAISWLASVSKSNTAGVTTAKQDDVDMAMVEGDAESFETVDLQGVHPLVALIAALARARQSLVRGGLAGGGVTEIRTATAPTGSAAAGAATNPTTTTSSVVTSGMRCLPWVRRDGRDRTVFRCVLADVVGAATAISLSRVTGDGGKRFRVLSGAGFGPQAGSFASGSDSSTAAALCSDVTHLLFPYTCLSSASPSSSAASSAGPALAAEGSISVNGGGVAAVLKDLFSLQAAGGLLLSFDCPTPFYAPPTLTASTDDASATVSKLSSALSFASAIGRPGGGVASRSKDYGIEVGVALLEDRPAMLGDQQSAQLIPWLCEKMRVAAEASIGRLSMVKDALHDAVMAPGIASAAAAPPPSEGGSASEAPGAGGATAPSKLLISSWRRLFKPKQLAPAPGTGGRAIIGSSHLLSADTVLAQHRSISRAVEAYFGSIATTTSIAGSGASAAPASSAAPSALLLPAVPAPSLSFPIASASAQMALVKDASAVIRKMMELLQEESDEVEQTARASAASDPASASATAGVIMPAASFPPLLPLLASRLITPLAVLRVLVGQSTPRFPPQAFRDVPSAAAEILGNSMGSTSYSSSVWGRYGGRDLNILLKACQRTCNLELREVVQR